MTDPVSAEATQTSAPQAAPPASAEVRFRLWAGSPPATAKTELAMA